MEDRSDWFWGAGSRKVCLVRISESPPRPNGTDWLAAMRSQTRPGGASAARALDAGRALAPGVLVALLVAGVATELARFVPIGSAPVLGIVLGVCVGSLLGPRSEFSTGVRWASSWPLRAAVVVLGAEIRLSAVVSEGARSLPVILITLSGCLPLAMILGRRLGVGRSLRTLIGVGTGVCGASAIAAVTPVIEAERLDVGYAVATIFLFNVLAVLTFPPFGHALGLTPHAFGVLSGTAVNDLSSVVAAANVYGGGALHTAVVVKLTRTLMIVPICAVLATLHARSKRAETLGSADMGLAHGSGRWRLRGLIPPFLIGFLALAAFRSMGVIPASAAPGISAAASVLITIALSAVGLSINLPALRRTGAQPILLGAILWLAVTGLSLAAQAAGVA